MLGAWLGRAGEQLSLTGAWTRELEIKLSGRTPDAFNKYFLNYISAITCQALLDTEIAKVNERSKRTETKLKPD